MRGMQRRVIGVLLWVRPRRGPRCQRTSPQRPCSCHRRSGHRATQHKQPPRVAGAHGPRPKRVIGCRAPCLQSSGVVAPVPVGAGSANAGRLRAHLGFQASGQSSSAWLAALRHCEPHRFDVLAQSVEGESPLPSEQPAVHMRRGCWTNVAAMHVRVGPLGWVGSLAWHAPWRPLTSRSCGVEQHAECAALWDGKVHMALRSILWESQA